MSKRNTLVSLLISVAATAALLGAVVKFRSRTLAHGCFHQVAHKGSGCATLVREATGTIRLRLINFETAPGNDLRVLLTTAPDARENTAVEQAERIDLGPLQSPNGFQEYVVPFTPNLTAFRSVTIWSNRYRVNYATAPLQQ